MNILISSVGLETSVNLIRYFKKEGDIVTGMDINPYGYTSGSILADKYEQGAIPMAPDYIDKVCEIIKKNDIDIFIPNNDFEVLKISQNIDKIPCKCVIPDFDTVNIIRDKLVCSQRIGELGFKVPSFLNKEDGGNKILRERVSVGSKGITYYSNGAIVPVFDPGTSFLQKTIKGQEYTVDILADKDGTPLYIVPRKRIEVKSGIATKVSIEKDEGLIDEVKKLLESIKLPGFSNIQFMKDDDNVNWFVEINGRFSGAGAATLATCPGYLKTYKQVCEGTLSDKTFNKDVKWGSVVTRYYEETVYTG